jgi:hypothetical protein
MGGKYVGANLVCNQQHAERSQGARAEARMVKIQILDDEHHGLAVAGGMWRKQGAAIGGLMLEKAETCFVLPLQEAVVHFSRQNVRSTDTAEMGAGSDNGDTHMSIDAATCFGAGFLPLLGKNGG